MCSAQKVEESPAETNPGPRGKGRRRGAAHPVLWTLLGCGVALAGVGYWETQTSYLQARYFSHWAAELTFELSSGPAPFIRYPETGPANQRYGYTHLPTFAERLTASGFEIGLQARQSVALRDAMQWGLTPPYRETANAGLVIRDASNRVMHAPQAARPMIAAASALPPVVLQSLLFIEDRRAYEHDSPTANPAVDWQRLGKAATLQAAHALGFSVRREGGSTLATQMEKYRHFEDGRTETGLDKLRQMISASLRAYRHGPETVETRRQVVVDYLNTMPLAAAPGHGEVHGLGPGLQAWFGLELDDVLDALADPARPAEERAQAYQAVLALICALPAPSRFLLEDRPALAQRMQYYTVLLYEHGVIDRALFEALDGRALRIAPAPLQPISTTFVQRKAVNSLRYELRQLLGVQDLYTLDRLHLDVHSSIAADLQSEVEAVLTRLAEPEFVRQQGLIAPRLLARGDPAKIIYTFLLAEAGDDGNWVRVRTDTADRPLDLNSGMKLELGSTAKLRALVHYLELVANLHQEIGALGGEGVQRRYREAPDALTRWVASQLLTNPNLDLVALLRRALDREYSASPDEMFYTGAGLHRFQNYNAEDNTRRMSVREAAVRSTNLVFVRLMRDLVRYHEARLDYDAALLLQEPGHPQREALLREIADEEAREFLWAAYRTFRQRDANGVLAELLGIRSSSPRHLAIVYHAWHAERSDEGLAAWLRAHGAEVPSEEIARLRRAYANPNLNLADWGYLLGVHPLEVWAAGELIREPGLAWSELLARSEPARPVVARWLLQTRNRGAQERRLRARFERDAFARMTPYWQALGFPFNQLVPSLATALGSAADRPDALAELMGVIANDGVYRPLHQVERLNFAPGTPYHTVYQQQRAAARQVIAPEVAKLLREVLFDVVDEGTGRRLRNAFVDADGVPLPVGGKTGSGDNRHKSFDGRGRLISSRVINRTASFAFYLDARFFGVITATVEGDGADEYVFTSSLPLAVLRLMAPALSDYIYAANNLLAQNRPDVGASLEEQ